MAVQPQTTPDEVHQPTFSTFTSPLVHGKVLRGLQLAKLFAWSDAGSTTNNTRRSSPTDLGQLSNEDIWDFEESLALFSSPTSERNNLPDTLPLMSAEQGDPSCTPMKKVDFSETASTIYRSSPFGWANEPKDYILSLIILHLYHYTYLNFILSGVQPALTYHSLSATWPITRVQPGMRNSFPRIFRDVEGAPDPAELLGSSSH
ncbi:hypothetical protein V8C43DRAFT_2792 [Trichoderma afarasin]